MACVKSIYRASTYEQESDHNSQTTGISLLHNSVKRKLYSSKVPLHCSRPTSSSSSKCQVFETGHDWLLTEVQIGEELCDMKFVSCLAKLLDRHRARESCRLSVLQLLWSLPW